MRFFMIEFIYNVKSKNIFKIRMRSLYPSFVGTVNIVFTLSMLIFFILNFDKLNIFLKIVVCVAFLYFPLIHTLLMYLYAIRQSEDAPKNIKLSFCDNFWKANDVELSYDKIKVVTKKYDMCLIYLDTKEAYIVDESMTDIDKLYLLLKSKIC